jgi:Zn-dependent protease with chaperone function
MLPKQDIDDEELEIGEWFYKAIDEEVVIEKSGWAFETVQRIAKRLNQERENYQPIEPVVIWIPDVRAFATPGRYIYISRELLQRFSKDDPIAFILAHEIAHNDLGHIRLFSSYLKILKFFVFGKYLALLLKSLQLKFINLPRELEADQYAIKLCLKAGYDGLKCLDFFDVMIANSLDFGFLDDVFGKEQSEEDFDYLPENLRKWAFQLECKMEKIFSSHPALYTRKEKLTNYIMGASHLGKNINAIDRKSYST